MAISCLEWDYKDIRKVGAGGCGIVLKACFCVPTRLSYQR